MLKKFVTIKNVGRFKNYGASGDVELKRYNLLFAENGRGKTTLCAILRSLQSGVGAHVLGRTTLGSPDPPEIRILQDGGVLVFSNGAWSATVPEIVIFDAAFVSENVFSGDSVDIDQKRNLYRVIVGKDGVKLAKEIEDLDAASRGKAAEIKDKAAAIQALVPKDTTLDAFLALPADPAVDEKIAATERELDAVRQADEISKKPKLSTLTVPALPTGFSPLLVKTVDGIADDAEKRVAAQIAAHGMHARGQTWLSEGLGYVREDKCPFCAQGLAPAATLLDAYKAFFSKGYNDLRTAITTMRTAIDAALGDKQIAAFEKTLDQNTAAAEFWSRFCEIPPLEWDAGVGDRLRALRQAALAQLDRKAAAPLETIAVDGAFTAAADSVAALSPAAVAYNQSVAAANAEIDSKKAATGAADVKTVEAALANLGLVKKRHELDVKQACDAYQAALTEKTLIEQQKDATNLIQRILGRVLDGPGAEEVRRNGYGILAGLHIWRGHPLAVAAIDEIIGDPLRFRTEVSGILHWTREALTYGPVDPADQSKDAVRLRAFNFAQRVLASTISRLREIERSDQPFDSWPEAERQAAQGLGRLVDSVASEVYFASGAFERGEGPAPSEGQRTRFYREAGPLLDQLSDVGLPSVAHHLLETLEANIDTDPRGVFLRIGQVVQGGKRGGYQYESLAADLMVRLIERYLAEHRWLFRADEECRRSLLATLDAFVSAGWPSARRLAYRLEDIFR